MNNYIFLFTLLLSYKIYAIQSDNALKEDLIYIVIGKDLFPINLVENQISRELISILPLTSKLIQKSTAFVEISFRAKLKSTFLFSEKNSAIEVKKGDLLMNQGKTLILFKEPSVLSNDDGELIKIGNCEKIEELFDTIGKTQYILLWNTWNYENERGKVNPRSKYNSIMNYLTWKIFTFFCFLLI